MKESRAWTFVLAAIATLKSRPARYLLLLVVHTDLRMAEAKRLRWCEVSLVDRKLYLSNARVIELDDDAIGLIKSIKRTTSEWVVLSVRDPNSTVTNVEKAWEDVRRRAKLDIRIDDLRRYTGKLEGGDCTWLNKWRACSPRWHGSLHLEEEIYSKLVMPLYTSHCT